MKDQFLPGHSDIPEDLRALDEELSSIRYEERASFKPELRAELAREWARRPTRRPSGVRHRLAAAALVGLLVGGAAVPSARASFVRLVDALRTEPVELETFVPAPVPAQPVIEEEVPAPTLTEVSVDVVTTPLVVEVVAPEIIAESPLVAPEMLDRARSEGLLADAYPLFLQRQGVGGTVWIRLWVNPAGSASFANADESWTDAVLLPAVDPLTLPTVDQSSRWELRDALDLAALPGVPVSVEARENAVRETESRLALALDDAVLIAEFGPVEAILLGEAPVGNVTPTRWRDAVGAALELGIEQGRENPASLLALGRIRLRQGLRMEARGLFEQGLQMATGYAGAGTPWVVAELHYERGKLVRDNWLASNHVGRVRAEAFSGSQCTQARSTGGSGTGFASAERLIAWNYLCPTELPAVFAEGFRPTSTGSMADLTLMMASFRASIEAYPAHVPANTDLLVTLASEGRWEDVLSGSRRLTRVTSGHPNGLLLAGLALHRLDRSAEAVAHFEAAFARMSDERVDALNDIGFLLDGTEERQYHRLSAAERRVWQDDFWKTKDRTPSTLVNERRAEHLARAAYAQLRFGSVFGDAGEVWVRFGGPTSIHIVDEGSGRLTEFWNYGSGPDITFVRWVASKRTDLTPEGRAYVDDLGKIFPPQ